MAEDERTAMEKWYDSQDDVDRGEAAEIVGQGDDDGPVQTISVDHSPDEATDLAPDETNAIRTDSEMEAGQPQGTLDSDEGITVEEDAVERINDAGGSVTVTNTSDEEMSESVSVVENVTDTSGSNDSSNDSSNTRSSNTPSEQLANVEETVRGVVPEEAGGMSQDQLIMLAGAGLFGLFVYRGGL